MSPNNPHALKNTKNQNQQLLLFLSPLVKGCELSITYSNTADLYLYIVICFRTAAVLWFRVVTVRIFISEVFAYTSKENTKLCTSHS